MNKQELIERLERLLGYGSRDCIERNEVLDLVKQLDEPKPVKVKQFVAKKIDYFKKTDDWGLLQVMDYLFRDKEIKKWLDDKNNQETFARAWLDGYEVEEEKRYTVKLTITKQYLYRRDNDFTFVTYTRPDDNPTLCHTRKELEDADFGWVFDCPGVEVEEVE